MKEFSFLRPLCGVALLIFSAASVAEVCFENLNNIVLEDPQTQDTQTYPVSPQDTPCTENGNLVLPFSLAQRGLTCSILDPNNNDQPIPDPIRVPLGATVPLRIQVAPTDIPVTNVAIDDSADNCDNGSLGTIAVPTNHDCSAVADDVISASVTVSGTGVPGVICTYNIQPDALLITNVNPQMQAVAVGDNGQDIDVTVVSVNGTSISGVDVDDNRGGTCTPSNQTVTGAGTIFSCSVANLPSASPVNGTLTASDGVPDNALDDTDTYTLEPLGLVITGVSPSSQVVNIGDTGDVDVSVRSNGGTINNVNVTDSRGGSCTPSNATVTDSADTVFDCTVAMLPTGSPANGTLTASATGATSDNGGYTLNPTQLTVAITNAPSCIDPGNLSFDITVTHNNTATDVVSVPVTVSGTPAGECDQTLPNVPSTGSSYTCSFTPSSLPASGSASTSSAEANDGSDSYNVAQCQGQLPSYCNLPEHNAVLAPGAIFALEIEPGFWNGGAWWNTPGSTEPASVPSGRILALPFVAPGPGHGGGDNVNNGTIKFTDPNHVWFASISDCPGDFSLARPFTSPPDTAIGTTNPGTNWCVRPGSTFFQIEWAMISSPIGSTCLLLQPGATYYLNIGAMVPDGSGGWTSTCESATCILGVSQDP